MSFGREIARSKRTARRKGWSKLSKADKYAVGKRGLFGRAVRPKGFPK